MYIIFYAHITHCWWENEKENEKEKETETEKEKVKETEKKTALECSNI